MTRAAALALLLLLLVPAAARAGWARGQVIPESRPAPGPAPEAEVVPGAGNRPMRIRVRGERDVVVPDSEGVSDAAVDVGRDGTIAVAWDRTRVCGGDDGSKAFVCGASVVATVWRRGGSPPPPAQLHDTTVAAAGADVAVGVDGTVMVGFDEVEGIYYDDPVGTFVAVGRAGTPLRTQVVARPAARSLGVTEVRGRPQIAWAQRAGRGTEVRVMDASAGATGSSRLEAVVRVSDEAGGVALSRTRRGDRLLISWSRRTTFTFRVGAPGRRLGRRRSIVAEGLATAMGPAGDYALVVRRSPRGVQRLRVLRGRTGSDRIRTDRLDPPSGSLYAADLYASVVIDRRGRTYLVYDTVVGPRKARNLRLGIAGNAATRGLPFGPGRVLSTRRPRAFCNGADLFLLRPGHAVARWDCAGDRGRSGAFLQQARYTADG